MESPSEIRYRRSRFSTRLPVDRRYTYSHFWVAEEAPGVWKVGFTRFATRMLGDFVELGFQVEPGDLVSVGQTIGWVEGFKALTDLYCVVEGEFLGGNPELDQDITLSDTDPYGRGWLYRARGVPDRQNVDVDGYVRLLDQTIDRMLQTSPGMGQDEGRE
ncbi:MAG: glycine cleavage system protein H [Armatimonadota bacterium]